MSLVHEVIAARHSGLQVFALCLVSNMVVLEYDTHVFVNEEEVLQMGMERSNDFRRFMTTMLRMMRSPHSAQNTAFPHGAQTAEFSNTT